MVANNNTTLSIVSLVFETTQELQSFQLFDEGLDFLKFDLRKSHLILWWNIYIQCGLVACGISARGPLHCHQASHGSIAGRVAPSDYVWLGPWPATWLGKNAPHFGSLISHWSTQRNLDSIASIVKIRGSPCRVWKCAVTVNFAHGLRTT